MNNDRIKENEEISLHEVMKKIHNNIQNISVDKKSVSDVDPIDASSTTWNAEVTNESIHRDLSYINCSWDIHNNNYNITTHRPYIGHILVKGRKLVHGEVRRYIDPMVSRQSEFNASTVRILNQTSILFSQISDRILQLDIELQEKLLLQRIELSQIITQQNEKLNNDLEKSLASQIQIIFSDIDKNPGLQEGLTHFFHEHILKEFPEKYSPDAVSLKDIDYLQFEEHFRGSREIIKQRQMEFILFFKNCSNVLDIGCGRGEFLEILQQNGIKGIGVDLDTGMVAYCISKNLPVEQGDAIEYLEKLDDNSLDGIFIDQVVEHLESAYVVRLISLCYRKLKFGHYIVIETVNPLSFFSFVNFYIDLTHKRPIHPDTLEYLMYAAGFRECQKKFSSPVPDNARLQKVEIMSSMDDTIRNNSEIFNHNIEILNSVLFGPQDYSVIGKK